MGIFDHYHRINAGTKMDYIGWGRILQQERMYRQAYDDAFHKITEVAVEPPPPVFMSPLIEYDVFINNASVVTSHRGRSILRLAVTVQQADGTIPEDAPGSVIFAGAMKHDKPVAQQYLVSLFDSFCEAVGVRSPGLMAKFNANKVVNKSFTCRFRQQEDSDHWSIRSIV